MCALKKSLPILSFAFCLLVAAFCGACSHDQEPMRQPSDIVGVWTPGDSLYLDMLSDNSVRALYVEEQDGLSIGTWHQEVYFYEPGYNLLIYIDYKQKCDVYQIIELTDKEMTMCWVENIKAETVEKEGIGKIVGHILNEAQEGFKLDPAYYQTLHRISEDQFLEIVENISILDPW